MLVSSVAWNRGTVVLFEIGMAMSANIALKVNPVLAVGQLQRQLSIGQLRLVTLGTLGTLVTAKSAFATPPSG
jgi:hypothetical protein